jgi:hypothetical protein
LQIAVNKHYNVALFWHGVISPRGGIGTPYGDGRNTFTRFAIPRAEMGGDSNSPVRMAITIGAFMASCLLGERIPRENFS